MIEKNNVILENELFIPNEEEKESNGLDAIENIEKNESVIKEIAEKIKENSDELVEKKIERKRPSLFVNDEKIKVEISVLYSYETGEILSVFAHTLPVDNKIKELMGVEELIFEFSKMSYDQLRGYRDVCSYIDSNTKALQINTLKMRDCYIYYHLRGWNLKDDDGKDIEIKLNNESNSLSEESAKIFFNLSPAIIDIAINEFENKLNISQ